ncbi:uncharacterized protein TNCT_479091 [Trichonephila clavata]|uniref:Uncharacterized protein n=1 Tax=Trichonephila clavata TaxID=2740835 RepID=A0A8X6KL95_TRICU|nr:uncharacterized protein TNCT_479091 [Trichonephila clavata]
MAPLFLGTEVFEKCFSLILCFLQHCWGTGLRASKVFQIERWCYANWDLHAGYGQKRNDFLAQVLSSEGCWEKVNTLHGVKLNKQIVGKKLITPPDSDNPFSTKRYNIACRCCLEEDIIALFEDFKQKRNVGDGDTDSLRELVSNLSGDPLVTFWSHFVSGYISKLDLNGLHPYEYGLKCAMDLKQAEAVEFFWNKIKSLPENELSAQQKDEMSPDKYPELLKRDLAENRYYGSLNALQDALRFDQFQRLFDCLKPNDLSDKKYSCLLWSIKLGSYSEPYIKAAIDLFVHMWMREGFDNHRALVLKEEMTDSGLQGDLLVPLVKRDYMEPVWAVLDKAIPEQIKEFMNSKQADHIRSTLKEKGDEGSLDKFLSYGRHIIKGVFMPNEERPQDFELIELLIQEAAASTSVQQSSGVDESFKGRFQSYIDQIPSYMHSVEKKGFFPHFFFGSFSTLLDTEIAEKLDIEKICFSFDGPQTLKVAVIKKGEIKNREDAIDKVRLFVISEQDAKIATQKFSYGELRDALGKSHPARFQPVFDNKSELKVKLVTINKDKRECSKKCVKPKKK